MGPVRNGSGVHNHRARDTNPVEDKACFCHALLLTNHRVTIRLIAPDTNRFSEYDARPLWRMRIDRCRDKGFEKRWET